MPDSTNPLKCKYDEIHQQKQGQIRDLLQAIEQNDEAAIVEQKLELNQIENQTKKIRKEGIGLIARVNPKADTNDTNYIFLN